MNQRERAAAQARQVLAVKGASPLKVTAKGKPGEVDIEDRRKEQKKMRWDSETVRMAMTRYYPTRLHAKHGIAQERPSG